MPMFAITERAGAPTLEDAARRLGIGVADIDPSLGVTLIDPSRHFYVVVVKDGVTVDKRSCHPSVNGPLPRACIGTVIARKNLDRDPAPSITEISRLVASTTAHQKVAWAFLLENLLNVVRDFGVERANDRLCMRTPREQAMLIDRDKNSRIVARAIEKNR